MPKTQFRATSQLIDFAVPKAMSQSLTEQAIFISFGEVVGMLEVMNAEQAKVNLMDIDTCSGIYARGMLMVPVTRRQRSM